MQRILVPWIGLLLFLVILTSCTARGDVSGPSFTSSSSQDLLDAHEPEEPEDQEGMPSVPAKDTEAPDSSQVPGEETSPSSSATLPESAAQGSGQEEGRPLQEEAAEKDGVQPIPPWEYQKMLGKGLDVDWSKTKAGRKYYRSQAAEDFAKAGISHVRIRISEKATNELLDGLDQQIADCLKNGILPVIAYQADEFKNDPNEKNIQKVVDWWSKVAERYQDTSYLLAFDLLIEATDALNQQPQKLNEIYERLVTEIRKTNPQRIIMISPRLRSDAAYLKELEIPQEHNGYLMAEWHFYASGPSKTNERKLWTTGTSSERALIDEKIALALKWQEESGIPTWVGAWMPGNYNDGNDYTVAEQVEFASYMTRQLTNAGIPFAVNSDTKFYDRESNEWIAEMSPVFSCIFD